MLRVRWHLASWGLSTSWVGSFASTGTAVQAVLRPVYLVLRVHMAAFGFYFDGTAQQRSVRGPFPQTRPAATWLASCSILVLYCCLWIAGNCTSVALQATRRVAGSTRKFLSFFENPLLVPYVFLYARPAVRQTWSPVLIVSCTNIRRR